AEKAIFMEKGEVKFFGNTADLLARPDILRAIYVKGSGALIEGAPATALKSERELRRYELEQSRPLLEVKDLTKRFGGITAVDGVSFDLREGEALGLIGPNGAGKTTIFDLISGYQQADEGQVLFEGLDVTTLRPDELARKRLVRRFQDARMFPSLTVYENILVALERKLEVRSFVFTAMQVPQVRQSERRARLRAEKLIELLDLGPFRDKFVKELSTGLRRISDLACVLAAEPRVLLLDEPSSGIAQAESEGLGPLLRRVRFETGCSMLVIEHDMPLISAISDELIALDQGKTLLRGTPDEVLNDERVIESYLGTSQEVIQRSGVLT
ncbi:MAG TPA: ABC transporter ATP-binding protein, partial [Actinomycetota bacterium]|nr:ABC transporter ATP-binding protein [Actinomycetota bacterium]